LATANVDIGAITIHRTGDDAAAGDTASPDQDAGWIEIVADGGTHNLLELQGVTADLGTAILEGGNYNQIRMGRWVPTAVFPARLRSRHPCTPRQPTTTSAHPPP
jgi:hypothetical protein